MLVLSDVSSYVRLALSASNVWRRSQQQDTRTQQQSYEAMMNTVEQLRQSIKNSAFLLQQFKYNRLSIAEFDEGLFWGCVPLLLKNSIGLLTVSEQKFQTIKTEYAHYDLLEKDLFVESSKHLKVASISYNIINAQDEKAITPKHLLFGNELFHHTRSANLLKMTNRLGHTCGYDTILRLHPEAAEQARQPSDRFNFIHQQEKSHQHNFVIKVADNFDLNPDGAHGKMESIHILNQILVSTSENDEVPIIVSHLINDLIDHVIEAIDDSSVRHDSFSFTLVY